MLSWLSAGIVDDAATIEVVVLGVGPGVLILWNLIGSQFQESTAAPGPALAVVHVGMIGTPLLIAGFVSFFVSRFREPRSRSGAALDDREVELDLVLSQKTWIGRWIGSRFS